MIANISKYTTEKSTVTSFNMVEHEMTRRELWMQAAVAACGAPERLFDPVALADDVLASFDKKFSTSF